MDKERMSSATGWGQFFDIVRCLTGRASIHPFYGPLGFCPGLPRWVGTRKL